MASQSGQVRMWISRSGDAPFAAVLSAVSELSEAVVLSATAMSGVSVEVVDMMVPLVLVFLSVFLVALHLVALSSGFWLFV